MPHPASRTARDLVRLQVDEALDRWRAVRLPRRPGNGWARTIRTALGMPSRFLAAKMGMTDVGVRKLEDAEAADTITLASLHKLADALDCELQYALVPRKRLEDVLLERARFVAREQFGPAAHTMALEQQGVPESSAAQQIEALARALVSHGGPRELWR